MSGIAVVFPFALSSACAVSPRDPQIERGANCMDAAHADVPPLLDVQNPDGHACLTAGCQDGVSIVVEDADGRPIDAFTGVVRVAGREIQLDCGGTTVMPPDPAVECSAADILFYGTPDCIEMVLTAGTASFSGVVTPQYMVMQPNGPECFPVCRRALIHVRLE